MLKILGGHGRQTEKSRSVLAAFLSAVLPCMAGCTGIGEWYHNGFKVGPNYSTTAARVSDAWIDSSDPHLRIVQGDNVCWWTIFGDSTLNCLIAEASDQNLTVKMAGARILEARAQVGVANGNLFPQQQEATGQYTRNTMSANTYPFNFIRLPTYYYDNWSVGFDAAWELDFWGRFRRAIESADAQLDAQVESYDNVLVMLQAEVATNYIQMRAAEERLVLRRKTSIFRRKRCGSSRSASSKAWLPSLTCSRPRRTWARQRP